MLMNAVMDCVSEQASGSLGKKMNKQTMPASVAANKTTEMQSRTIKLSSSPHVVGAPQSPLWSTIQSLTS